MDQENSQYESRRRELYQLSHLWYKLKLVHSHRKSGLQKTSDSWSKWR